MSFYIYEMQYESGDRSHWVTHEQLDTPLCDVFDGTHTKNTAREYVLLAERLLDKEHADLENMEFEEMNRYIDSLEVAIEMLKG